MGSSQKVVKSKLYENSADTQGFLYIFWNNAITIHIFLYFGDG